MADLIKKIRTAKGDLQIDYNALANLPTISYKVDENGVLRVVLKQAGSELLTKFTHRITVNCICNGESGSGDIFVTPTFTIHNDDGTCYSDHLPSDLIGETFRDDDNNTYTITSISDSLVWTLETNDGTLWYLDSPGEIHDMVTLNDGFTDNTIGSITINSAWGDGSSETLDNIARGTTWEEYIALDTASSNISIESGLVLYNDCALTNAREDYNNVLEHDQICLGHTYYYQG